MTVEESMLPAHTRYRAEAMVSAGLSLAPFLMFKYSVDIIYLWWLTTYVMWLHPPPRTRRVGAAGALQNIATTDLVRDNGVAIGEGTCTMPKGKNKMKL